LSYLREVGNTIVNDIRDWDATFSSFELVVEDLPGVFNGNADIAFYGIVCEGFSSVLPF
jgi:hypothetical protein